MDSQIVLAHDPCRFIDRIEHYPDSFLNPGIAADVFQYTADEPGNPLAGKALTTGTVLSEREHTG